MGTTHVATTAIPAASPITAPESRGSKLASPGACRNMSLWKTSPATMPSEITMPAPIIGTITWSKLKEEPSGIAFWPRFAAAIILAHLALFLPFLL
jgi:hypothetical protein